MHSNVKLFAAVRFIKLPLSDQLFSCLKFYTMQKLQKSSLAVLSVQTDKLNSRQTEAKTFITRSIGTVHTSAKERLTSVAILIRIQTRIRDSDCHQNLTICLLVHCQPSLKISCKSVQKFFCEKLLTVKQTDRQRNGGVIIIMRCVSEKNVPPLTCYNFDIHDPITIIFGTSITKKVRNQTMLCFRTSPI